MKNTFTEFATQAFFEMGDGSLLQEYKKPTLTSHYIFIRSLQAPLSLHIDGVPIVLPPHHLTALTPNQLLQCTDDAFENIRVHQFNRAFYCIKDHDKEVSCVGLLFYGLNQTPIVALSEKEQQSFEALHRVFLEEFEHKDSIQAEMLRMLLARFIIKVTRIVKEGLPAVNVSTHSTDLLRNYNFLVENHFKEAHNVAFYAEKLFKSPKTLSNSFKKFNKTPLQIIHDRIILEAKRQLLYTDKTTKEIAFDIGFEDASHLSRMFKKVTSLSPSAYKQSIQNS